ncbi:ethanolamine ammonia-lyase subunit EutC [Pedobacter sp. BMA]|uniref:ethanolamine ammonia-lyase subunit EutC n=1 Tax=Pedobacter sp. BMA TaxID=1663685 RepID=UPI00064A2AC7|nr:ethanolamine ammonia-lyase subunit EutC [Pedobacter sp. BMA]KLT67432.1 hypothetical protein AB669_01685 [Pedobacter sp. BMA]
MLEKTNEIAIKDLWEELRLFTAARIALGRTGVSLPLSESLKFKLAHAHAQDAVYSDMDVNAIETALDGLGITHVMVESGATDRTTYLQRPDFGRKLSANSTALLQNKRSIQKDICIVIADGLSAFAVNENAVKVTSLFMESLSSKGFTFTPVVLAKQARVAIADEIAHHLNARLSVILIGERPGLSAYDSLGAYMTYMPQPGYTDEKRNCISNIRDLGLPPDVAAEKLRDLVVRSLQLKLSGVNLKDDDRPLLL